MQLVPRPVMADTDGRAGTTNLVDLRLLVDAAPYLMWMAAVDGTIEYVNQYGIDYAGFRPETSCTWERRALVHPDDADRVNLAQLAAVTQNVRYRIDCRIRRFDGDYRWHECHGIPVLDDAGEVLKWVGSAADIDAAKRLEHDLRAAERRTAESLSVLEMWQSKSPVGMALIDREGRYLRINDMLADMGGVSPVEHIGRTVAETVPTIWPRTKAWLEHVLQTGEAVLDVEIDRPAPSGSAGQRHGLASFYPVSNDVEIIGIGVVVVDVTAQKRAELELRQLATIIQNASEAIFSTTPDGVVTSWNPAAQRLFGYRAEEIIGRPLSVLAPVGRLPEQEGHRAALAAGAATQRRETVARHRDGRTFDVLVSGSTATDGAGRVIGLSIVVQDITERLQVQRALAASERRLAEAQRIAGLGSFEVDLITGKQIWSAELYRILGLDPGIPPTQGLFDSRMYPDDQTSLYAAWRIAVTDGTGFHQTYRIIRVDGLVRHIDARVEVELGDDGTPLRVSGTLVDNTEMVEGDRVRRAAQARFEAVFEQVGIGAGILDLWGRPIRLNAAACEILGRPEEILVGRSWAEFSHPDDVGLGAAMANRPHPQQDNYSDERRFLRPDGSVVWASLHLRLVRDERGEPEYYLAQLQDISGPKHMQQELTHQALHDTLTGLPNRALLTDRLRQGLANARRGDGQLAVIFIDIDHFKNINDSLGHTEGDKLLKQVAARARAVIRERDTVARFGGDEFVVLCVDVEMAEVEQIAGRILVTLGQPYQIAHQEVLVTMSIGIAVSEQDATPEALLRESDAAAQLAKDRGRGRIEVFDSVPQSPVEQRLATAASLRKAMERDQLTVMYQPVVDLDTGAMVGAEALLRWNHEQRGPISPNEFIPIAEDTGLIVPIGAWVLEQACEQLVRWRTLVPSMTVAVNLSVRQIVEPDIAKVIADVLERTGAPAESITLELTESVFMKDADYFTKILARIKALGVRLAIDDFGTGFSSLSYLKSFPVDAVKIDKAFVDGLGTDPHDVALVAAIVAMADALQLTVTAEGIETVDQLAMLARLQCHRGQGYHLARPMSASAIDALIAQSHRWVVR